MYAMNSVKSEASMGGAGNVGNGAGGGVTNGYDYMSSCLQSGYFGGTFGVAGNHVGGDLAGYHHQAAKLMATS